jgi:hypothetical protein
MVLNTMRGSITLLPIRTIDLEDDSYEHKKGVGM